MSTLQPIANPFALLLDPKAVLDRIEHSDRLERLHSRICRPLDKPVLPVANAPTDAADETDDPLDELN